MALITLMTDFGTHSEYAGVVKGVIFSINPAVTVVDITHHIAPQDVRQGAYTLASAYPHFPRGSIHLIVVDPGVGGVRDIVGVRTRDQIFLAPNNGVLSAVLLEQGTQEMVKVENDRYFLQPVSHTFHGRDIFAPAAAHLSLGLPLSALGPVIKDQELVRLDLPAPRIDQSGWLVGAVVDKDGFGNLITNISLERIEALLETRDPCGLIVDIGGRRINGLANLYAAVPHGELLAIIGSRNYLEVALRNGDAAGTLGIMRDDVVRVGLVA